MTRKRGYSSAERCCSNPLTVDLKPQSDRCTLSLILRLENTETPCGQVSTLLSFSGPGTDMSFASFVQAHAAHADCRVALAQSQRQVQTRIAPRAAHPRHPPPSPRVLLYSTAYYPPPARASLI